MSRFFVAPSQVGASVITIEDRGDLHHMMKVLRLQPGDEVEISDGEKWEYQARIDTLDADCAALTILDKQSFSAEPNVRVTLYQGVPKQGKMETIVQKCTELGIHRIVPVFMDRTVVVDRGKFGKKVERWQKVAAESVKQCKRGRIPEIAQAMRMPQVLEELSGPGAWDLILLPYENEEGRTIKDVLRLAADKWKTETGGPEIAVLIGPEGGFSDAEVEAITAAGGHSVTLGKTTLRTETAGMAALAMIMYELEL